MPTTTLVRISIPARAFVLACCTAIASLAAVADGIAQPVDRAFSSGLRFAAPGDLAKIPTADTPFTGPTLPEAHDLTSNFPDPGDQGKQGSCVGWAVAYAMKSYQEKVERQWNWSDDTRYSAAWVYNHTKMGDGCFGGTTFPRALGFVQQVGTLSHAKFPYNQAVCDRIGTDDEKKAAKDFRILSFRRVDPGNEFAIKAQIAAGNPVLIGMAIDKAFVDHKGDLYQGPTGPAQGGHAVTIIGYDDRRGGYKIINSWGTKDWGAGGYGWLAYGVFAPARSIVLEAYVAVDETNTPYSPTKPASSPAGAARTYDVIYRRFESFGVATTPSKKTGDHHCSSNCDGEPTKTHYPIVLEAARGHILRNPRLLCEGQACPWTKIDYVQISERGRVVKGGWFSWGSPTIWRLEAEEVQAQDVRRVARQARPGEVFDIEAPSTDPPPLLAITVNGREERVGEGFNAPASGVEFVGRQDKGNLSVFTFKVASGT